MNRAPARANQVNEMNLRQRSADPRQPPTWESEIPVNRSIILAPDPHLMESIGANHRFETALADLIDNAIDAQASRVLIRFVIESGDLKSLYVVDDGNGIAPDMIDEAMRMGGARTYASNELGHFGVGLKAASFSQAGSVTLISRTPESAASGRRWLARKASRSYECDIVDEEFCEREMRRAWGFVTAGHGTIIRWDEIRTSPAGNDPETTGRFVNDATLRLQQHLGLVFHRFLSGGVIVVGIDVEDVSLADTGPLVDVKALDPFGYARTGAAEYPKQLRTTVSGQPMTFVCHVWPGRSQLPQFRISTAPSEQWEGFYFYRRDRLLQAGGWNGIEVQQRDLQLARVAIDIPDDLVASQVLQMNPEKSHVEGGHDFAASVSQARAEDGTTFRFYIETARESFKQSNQRHRARKPVIPLGRGVPAALRRTVEQELAFLPGRESVDIRWCDFEDDSFFAVDRGANTIWLNNRYRAAVIGYGKGSLNDAALVKMLLFLLTENVFHGAYMGPKDKDDVELWQILLTAAIKRESD